MKVSFPILNPDFVYDQKGHKKAVILDIKEFEDLVEGLEDFYDIVNAYKAKEESSPEAFSLESVIEEILLGLWLPKKI